MQFQAKYPADPVGSHEAKIKSHPGPLLLLGFEDCIFFHGAELPVLLLAPPLPVSQAGPTGVVVLYGRVALLLIPF